MRIIVPVGMLGGGFPAETIARGISLGAHAIVAFVLGMVVLRQELADTAVKIPTKDTKPEMMIRRGLHALGMRYRLGWNYRVKGKVLRGRPDLVFPQHQAVLFIHGCFWHGHGCHLFRWPQTDEKFWREKIERNVSRDQDARDKLIDAGWRVGIVWECALKGIEARLPVDVIASCCNFIRGSSATVEIRGTCNHS